MPKSPPKGKDVLTMSQNELQQRVAKAHEYLAAIDQLLPGLVGLTPDQRRSSKKYRAGEAEALGSVLDAAKKKPALFESLAAHDEGVDPETFEIELLRDRLSRVAILGDLASACQAIRDGIDDTTLQLGNLSKGVLLDAYDIAKIHAKRDGSIAKAIAPALEFYGRIGRAAANTKKKRNKPSAKE